MNFYFIRSDSLTFEIIDDVKKVIDEEPSPDEPLVFEIDSPSFTSFAPVDYCKNYIV